jgi:hypothetical protein
VESFNGKRRDELFAREVFDTILEARVLYDDWRELTTTADPTARSATRRRRSSRRCSRLS